MDQEFLCIWCKYTFKIIIIHVYWLNVRPHAKRVYPETKLILHILVQGQNFFSTLAYGWNSSQKFGLRLESCTNMGLLIFRRYLVSRPISAWWILYRTIQYLCHGENKQNSLEMEKRTKVGLDACFYNRELPWGCGLSE